MEWNGLHVLYDVFFLKKKEKDLSTIESFFNVRNNIAAFVFLYSLYLKDNYVGEMIVFALARSAAIKRLVDSGSITDPVLLIPKILHFFTTDITPTLQAS